MPDGVTEGVRTALRSGYLLTVDDVSAGLASALDRLTVLLSANNEIPTVGLWTANETKNLKKKLEAAQKEAARLRATMQRDFDLQDQQEG